MTEVLLNKLEPECLDQKNKNKQQQQQQQKQWVLYKLDFRF